jgi:hypothetical protein
MIDGDLDIYYESLKRVYDELEQWKKPGPRPIQRVTDWLLGGALVLTGLSVIPVIPAILMFSARTIPIRLGPVDTTSGSFNSFSNLWLALFITTIPLALLFNWINDRIDHRYAASDRPPHRLSADQITFVRIYQSYKELKVHLVSHVDKHLEIAYAAARNELTGMGYAFAMQRAAALDQLQDAPPSRLDLEATDAGAGPIAPSVLFPFGRSPHTLGSLSLQVRAAIEFIGTFSKYRWFELNEETRSALSALISLSSKVLFRLRDGRELPAVLNLLENLSSFLYAFLPEHEVHMEAGKLAQLRAQGKESLRTFVSQVTQLSDYLGAPPQEVETETGVMSRLRQRALTLYRNFVVIRFAFWLLVLLLLTSAGVAVIDQMLDISPDAIASIIIGTSVVGAAALAVFLPPNSRGDSHQ